MEVYILKYELYKLEIMKIEMHKKSEKKRRTMNKP